MKLAVTSHISGKSLSFAEVPNFSSLRHCWFLSGPSIPRRCVLKFDGKNTSFKYLSNWTFESGHDLFLSALPCSDFDLHSSWTDRSGSPWLPWHRSSAVSVGISHHFWQHVGQLLYKVLFSLAIALYFQQMKLQLHTCYSSSTKYVGQPLSKTYMSAIIIISYVHVKLFYIL